MDAGRNLARFARTLLIGLCVAVVGGFGGYHGALHYLSSESGPAALAGSVARAEAVRLRHLTNETVRLMDDFLLRFPLSERSGSVDDHDWARREFAERLDALHKQLPADGGAFIPELSVLLDRMRTMAMNPSDQALRRAAAEQLASLCAKVNHHILGLNCTPKLDEAPLPFRVPPRS